MTMTRKEVDKQPLLIINDKNSKDVKLLVSPSDFQVGIDKKPSTLKVIGETNVQGGLDVEGSSVMHDRLTVAGLSTMQAGLLVSGLTILGGSLSLSTSTYSSGDSVSQNDTIALVFGGGSITLPSSPRTGRVVYVKDADGSASGTNIVVSAGGLLIDSSTTNTLTSNYQVRCYAYYSGQWYVIS